MIWNQATRNFLSETRVNNLEYTIDKKVLFPDHIECVVKKLKKFIGLDWRKEVQRKPTSKKREILTKKTVRNFFSKLRTIVWNICLIEQNKIVTALKF